MDVLVNLQKAQLEDDDPTTSYMLQVLAELLMVLSMLIPLQISTNSLWLLVVMTKCQAWARLCKCLGQDFLPYMNTVMPPLLRSAQLKPDVTITDADDSDDDLDSDDGRC